jgi:hypothetical protein
VPLLALLGAKSAKVQCMHLPSWYEDAAASDSQRFPWQSRATVAAKRGPAANGAEQRLGRCEFAAWTTFTFPTHRAGRRQG